jgi:hypothetical protein
VLVSGRSASIQGDDDYLTLKHHANGVLRWTASFVGGGHDTAHALVTDVAGNVYVTGKSAGSDASDDMVTVKYDPEVNEQRLHSRNGPPGGNDHGLALAIPPGGRLIVGGVASHQSGSSRVALLKLLDTITLSDQVEANGSISGTTLRTVLHGGSGTSVLVEADPGNLFEQCNDVSTNNPRTDSGVTANTSVSAWFAPVSLFANGFEP